MDNYTKQLQWYKRSLEINLEEARSDMDYHMRMAKLAEAQTHSLRERIALAEQEIREYENNSQHEAEVKTT